MLTDKSISDFNTKKAAYYDEEGFQVADEENRGKLKAPRPIQDKPKE